MMNDRRTHSWTWTLARVGLGVAALGNAVVILVVALERESVISRWLLIATLVFAFILSWYGYGSLRVAAPRLEAVYRKLVPSSPHSVTSQVATVMGQFAKRRGRVVHSGVAILLIAGVLLLLIQAQASLVLTPYVALALMAAALLLELSFITLLWRLKRGLYGTTEYEARQVVRFILTHVDDVDFSGGLGARPMLLSDEVLVVAERSWGLTTR